MNVISRTRYSRNCTNDTFPLPSIVDCLWYAFTEAGEVVDARLRMAQPAHLRNNARNVDPRHETGQVLYMLASAYVQVRRDDSFQPWGAGVGETELDFAIAEACHYTVAAIADTMLGDENGVSIMLAMRAWCNVCVVADWNADQLIDETCAEFEKKHCVVREVL